MGDCGTTRLLVESVIYVIWTSSGTRQSHHFMPLEGEGSDCNVQGREVENEVETEFLGWK